MKIKRALFVVVLAVVVVVASCSKSSVEGILDSGDVQVVNSESVSSSSANEAADMVNSVISNISDTQLSQTRVEWTAPDLSAKDKRLTSAVITVAGTGTKNNPMGTITIDFGKGVSTEGVARKGKIVVDYSGRRLQPGSYRKIQFGDYYRDAIKLTGYYHSLVSDSSKSSTDLKVTFKDTIDVKLTFPDSTKLARIEMSIVAWDYVIATPAQSTIDHKEGTTASGTTRKGDSYSMSVTKDLVYPMSCLTTGYPLPQSGSKTLTVTATGSTNNDVFTFNFGASGTSTACTSQVTIMYNGKSETIVPSASGN